MAYLKESSTWEPSIYLIQTTDAPTGGESGICNIQARQLANRTVYLRDFFNKEHSEWCDHAIDVDDIADDSEETVGIKEESFSFTETSKGIYNEYSGINSLVANLKKKIDAIVSGDASLILKVYKALVASWRYMGLCIDICLFTDEFNFADTKKYHVAKTINNDDSIDIADGEDISSLVIGQKYGLVDPTDNTWTEITIKNILDNNRILVSPDLSITSENKFVLSHCSMDISNKSAIASAGSFLYTKAITSLKNTPCGYFDLVHTGVSGNFIVKYFSNDTSEWCVLPIKNTYIDSDGYTVDTYTLTGADVIYLYIYSKNDATINYMSVYGDISSIYNNFIRTPKIYNSFIIDRYGALYRDAFYYLEVELGNDYGFSSSRSFKIYSLTFDTNTTLSIESQVRSIAGTFLSDYNVWRARYVSSKGYMSGYSNILPIR